MIMDLWNELGLDVLGLTETWQRPLDRFVLPLQYEAITKEPMGNRNRGHSGAAIAINNDTEYELIAKAEFENCVYVTIRIHRTFYTVVYVGPSTDKEELKEVLESIRRVSRGPSIIMGDFNARHLLWDSCTKPRGTALYEWAATWGWSITAAAEPSFTARQGRSNIDLFISKGIAQLEQPWIPRGTWDGCSDHRPVVTSFEASSKRKQTKGWKISYKKRDDPETAKLAKLLAEKEIPKLYAEVQRARTQVDLDRVYTKYKKIAQKYWTVRNKQLPSRFRFFWTRELDELAKSRTEAYEVAMETDSSRAWNKHKQLNRQIKRKVQQEKLRCFELFAEELNEGEPNKVQGVMKRIQRAKKGYTLKHKPQGKCLDLKDFTASLHEGSRPPVPVRYENNPFNTSEVLEHLLYDIIVALPKKKAAGPDLIIAEAMQAAPTTHARFLARLWTQCGKIRTIPTDWLRAAMVPLYKKGDTSDPLNHRPIALLSHARKVIEKLLDADLRGEYDFHLTQLGFRRNQGTEVAILRATNTQDAANYIAVLDLKQAYPTVPRDKLLQLAKERLSENLYNQIEYFLQAMTFYTVGDETETTGQFERGVAQGSSLSPALYNLFMDTFAEKLLASDPELLFAIIMFADDVQLRSKTRQGLQKLLDAATAWAEENHMTWSITKCLVISEDSNPPAPFKLAGGTLKEVREAEYLGITMNLAGITTTHLLNRLSSAQQRLGQLNRIGMNKKGLNLVVNRRLFISLIRSMTEYQLHLTPAPYQVRSKYRGLEQQFFRTAGGFKETKTAWWRKVFKLPSIDGRRYTLREGLKTRLTDSERPELTFLQDALEHAGNVKPAHDQRAEWAAADHGKQRQVPLAPDDALPPVLQFKTNKHRLLGLQWYLHRFPRCVRTIREELGESGSLALEDLGLLRKETLTPQEKQLITNAIDFITDETD